MVDWLVENGWCPDADTSAFSCSQVLLKHNIIQPVYPFIKNFVNDRVLYKFTKDLSEETLMKMHSRRESTLNIAQDACRRKLQDAKRRDKTVTEATRRSSLLGNLMGGLNRRKCVDKGSNTSTTDEGSSTTCQYIAGNLLLDLIDKGPDMQAPLTCQLMLRYGFIEPLLEEPITTADLCLKQVFYAQETYQFSSTIARSVDRISDMKTRGSTMKPSALVAAIDRRLSVASRAGTAEVAMKHTFLEYVDLLDKPEYHCTS